MRNEVFLDFSGWVRLNSQTNMQYIGEEDDRPTIITIADWVKLPQEQREMYILEDAIAAIRDSDDLEYEDLKLTVNEYES